MPSSCCASKTCGGSSKKKEALDAAATAEETTPKQMQQVAISSSTTTTTTTTTTTGNSGCCKSGHCSEKNNEPTAAAAAAAVVESHGSSSNRGGGGGCCSSGKCTSTKVAVEQVDDDDDDDDDDPICLAVVREDGADIVLFDAKGIPRTFWYPIPDHTNNSNNSNNSAELVAGDIRRLCFSTHGLIGGKNGDCNDDLMTHCLDENGHHGTPSDEWCMCGVDTPHIHAHLHNPETCGSLGEEEEEEQASKMTCSNKNNSKSKINIAAMSLEKRFQFLATHILHPKEDPIIETTAAATSTSMTTPLLDIAVSERMPKECNSKHFSGLFDNSKSNKTIAKHKVRHEDHDDFLVHDKIQASLHLQHDCRDCGQADVHGKFRALARRRWKRQNSTSTSSNSTNRKNVNKKEQHIQIHFFDIAPDRPFCFLEHLDNLFSLDSDRVRAATALTTDHGGEGDAAASKATVIPVAATAAAGATMMKTSPRGAVGGIPQEDDATAATVENVGTAVVVRSTFHCSRICCASEIPVIKKALAPVHGIENILINVPLKQVIVDHVHNICTAQQVVQALNGYHLGAAVQRDGGAAITAAAATATTVGPESTMGRSQFYVANICCPAEIPMINGIVKPLATVEKVSINVTTKMVYVHHDYDVLTASDILMALNNEAFGAELRVDAAEAAARAAATSRSLFVTSQFSFTTTVESDDGNDDGGVNLDELKTFLQSYDTTQVECFVVDEAAGPKTITVIHNPNTLTANEICLGLATKTSIHAQILTDGGTNSNNAFDYDAAARLQYQDNDAAVGAGGADFKRFTLPKPTVMLSGLFWLISMLALLGGNFEYLKYVGLVSVAFGLPPIALKAFRTMRRFQFDTNCLMFFASVGALALGEFEEAAAVVFLFALSEWLEVRATTRAREALSAIVNLRPDKANLVHPETQELIVVPASIVPVGALVSVRTGDKIPCDGVVVEGASTVDESSLTGESRPIRKGPQDKVSGGTVNSGETQLMVRTIATAENSAVSRLIRLVEEAQANRSETEQLVDEFAKVYTPFVVLAALLMCTIPWAFGKELGRLWTNNGLVLIVVACPCALIISTPVSYVAGLATTAQKGILIKGGAYLESLGMVKHVCFDKTGTLTNGEFALLHLEEWVNNPNDGHNHNKSNRTEVLQYLALMESRAAHPVAQAILAGTRNEGVSIPSDMKLQKHTIIAGEGVAGVINGLDVHVGNERLFERLGLLEEVPEKILGSVASWKQLGGTIGYMSIEGRGIVCAYCAADAVRPEAAMVVAKLKQRGIQVTMLTGDNDDAAQAIGKQIGLEGPDQIRSKLLPEEKLAFVERLGEDSNLGRSALFSLFAPSNIILFCGDGVNDAPALAAANVGVAMGEGAALAMETADVTLLDSNLEKMFYSMDMGRRVIRKIWENIIFSISVKFLVLGFALSGRTHLWAAIASDVGAMILVTLNSMMLMPVRRGDKIEQGATLATKKIGDLEKGQGASGGCAKGCCGDSKPKPVAKDGGCAKGCCGDSKPTTPVVKGGGCAKGCCGDSKPTPVAKDGGCAKGCCGDSKPKPVAKDGGCAKGCCGDSKPTTPVVKGGGCAKGCCGDSKPTPVAKDGGCSKGCCGSSRLKPVAKDGGCAKGCCGDSKPTTPVAKGGGCAKGCCGDSKPTPVAKDGGCSKGCCGSSKPTPVANGDVDFGEHSEEFAF